MASTTILPVLRVKRRLDDNPQDALVLLCKRMKSDEEEISPSLFVFHATVDNQELSHVKSVVPKSNLKLKSASNINDILEKIRQEKKETAAENRYKVVNRSRGEREIVCTEDDDQFDLLDLHPTAEEADNEKYMYDLYLPTKTDFDISMLDNLVSIENYEAELILDRGNGEPGSDEERDDEDDSNDEDNWRNEYPDTEPSSIDEEDMVKAMENCDIDDLSSDDGEVYEAPAEPYSADADLYGEAYAKYKAKLDEEEHGITRSGYVHSSRVKDLDEEQIDCYKEDSDDGFYYGQDEDSERLMDEEKELSDEYSPD